MMIRTLVLLALCLMPLTAGAVTILAPAAVTAQEAGAWNKRPPRNFCDCTGCDNCRPGCRCK